MWGADTDSSNRWNLVYDAGARYRRLAVPGIEAFEGNGVYYAATHQEALICGTGPVVVVGGGNAAGQATLFLASRCSRVHLVIRGDDLGKNMPRYLVDQIQRHTRVSVCWARPKGFEPPTF
ncbi:MAG: thioredoxin reductase [Mycobacterium sp.]|uniref:FAD-dependent oxidoreductase n=1 Tax=Mycobacterium sp. TaxID=1785 RepID=UPI0026105124|nr:FAD-dependent oxidoreductase [Mycobacterium sp.]MCW2659134.1 thioredoxin reductase [Mycobacterium sp.]